MIGGWIPGEGRRAERIGALLMGYYDDDGLRYAGRVGTGFTEATLDRPGAAAGAATGATSNPFARSRRSSPREAEFVEPCLVAEVEFREWTTDGVMRAPSFKGLREDKAPREVTLEGDPARSGPRRRPGRSARGAVRRGQPLPGGALEVLIEGRRLKLSNWDKVLFPETGFTKGDLIAFYARIAPAVLPHLHDRPLTLKRYPNGVDRPYFYEKQSPSHRPDWVQTAKIDKVNYTLAQDRPTLVWLANLADVELHTSLSLAATVQRPTMLVFDLDPGRRRRSSSAARSRSCSAGCSSSSGSDGGQDLGVEGDADVRAARTRGRLRGDEAVRQAGGRAARAADARARRLAG